MGKMIKRVIKSQIRKTGMVRELENEKENLKNQLNILKKENERLWAGKTAMAGYSLDHSLRGLSSDAGKAAALKFILENIKKDAKIIDVGFGSGIYGKLLRAFYYENIDGIDVYGNNIQELGLDIIYDNIFIENIIDFDFDYYDLIIMGDVLEHIELDSAKNLLSRFVNDKKCGALLVSIPYEYEQEELYGNHFEKHLQSDVTQDYMKRHYPFLKLIDTSIMTHSPHSVGLYVWID